MKATVCRMASGKKLDGAIQNKSVKLKEDEMRVRYLEGFCFPSPAVSILDALQIMSDSRSELESSVAFVPGDTPEPSISMDEGHFA